MYHIVYLTTNLVNDKFYIGVHSTYNLEDGYLGSGTALANAIKKYGRKAFRRQILHYCLDAEDAYNWEKQIVTKKLYSSNLCYNIRPGGIRNHISFPGNLNPQSLDYLINAKNMTESEAKAYLKQKGQKGAKNRVSTKGKTYEEIYGEEKGKELRQVKSKMFKNNYESGKVPKKYGKDNQVSIAYNLISPSGEILTMYNTSTVATFFSTSDVTLRKYRNKGLIQNTPNTKMNGWCIVVLTK